jgi:hypothetical protein
VETLVLQGIQLSELTRKTVELEQKQAAHFALLTTLRDRDVVPELDSLRLDVNAVCSKVDAIQKSLQVINTSAAEQSSRMQEKPFCAMFHVTDDNDEVVAMNAGGTGKPL